MVVIFSDHYTVLGLPTGEKGLQVSTKDIQKAYKLKALELHPDKKPNDPNAAADFQQLQASFDVLKDEHARKVFNDELMIKLGKRREQFVTSVVKDSNFDAVSFIQRTVDEIRKRKWTDDEVEEMRKRVNDEVEEMLRRCSDADKERADRMSSEYENRYRQGASNFDPEQWEIYQYIHRHREIAYKRLHSQLYSFEKR